MEYDIINNCSGVYRIVNSLNNKHYIGSAININTRWKNHIKELKNNKHHSIHLQRSWNKYGEDIFKFEVIEYIEDKTKLVEREQYWIDFYQSYKREYGYNLLPKAGSMLGYKMPKEVREKLSLMRKGENAPWYGKKFTEEHRRNLSNSLMGRNVSEVSRFKISRSLKEYYKNNEHPKIKHSDLTKQKLSEMQKERIRINGHPMQGQKHSNDAKNKMKESHTGKHSGIDNNMYGKNHTEETKRKISESRKGKYVGINSPNYGKQLSIETKEKISMGRKGIYNGENNPSARLTEKQVIKIRELYKTGEYSYNKLAKIFNVSKGAINSILNYRTWIHI